MSQLVVDANILVKLVSPEEWSDLVIALWGEWIEQEVELVAPFLMVYEAVSALRSMVTRKVIAPETADVALRELLTQASQITIMEPPNLHQRAWEITKRLGQGQVYDAYYVALAEMLDCELWTADEKLYAASFRVYPKVKHIRSARRK